MWDQARASVESTFFKDLIELYVNEFVENDIGETLETQSLIGEYACNVQNLVDSVKSTISGQSLPHTLRISTVKGIPIDSENTYKVLIKQARIIHTDELWKVESCIEGQLSSVLTVSREGSI